MIDSSKHYIRDHDFSAVGRGDEYLFVRGEKRVSLSPVPGDALSELLGALAVPLPGTALAELAGDLLPAVQRLIREGVVIEGDREELLARCRSAVPRFPRTCRHLVVGVSGGILAGLVHQLLVELMQGGFAEKIDVVFTESSLRFANRSALEYFGVRTWEDAFESKSDVRVPHIQLATSADMVLIIPASAHLLHRLSSGACSDLLSLIATATRAPVVLVPAMNRTMWTAPAVARNAAQLRRDGFHIIDPGIGFPAAATERGDPEIGPPGVRLNAASLAAVLAAIAAR